MVQSSMTGDEQVRGWMHVLQKAVLQPHHLATGSESQLLLAFVIGPNVGTGSLSAAGCRKKWQCRSMPCKYYSMIEVLSSFDML